MEFMLNMELKKYPNQIDYHDKILLIGSCFTEHIGDSLSELKFSILQNPNGILYDPLSVSDSLLSYIQNKQYTESDLFQLNELWHSWQHHSRFSNTDIHECLRIINKSQQTAHNFLKEADWVIITFGTAYSYRLTPGQSLHSMRENVPPPEEAREKPVSVANCHKAPAEWFNKHLLSIDDIVNTLDNCMRELLAFNSKLKIIFTLSPVRHIRDGIAENNRSKARLIESIHHLVNKCDPCFYFPAYEIVIDVLRDYRFYDADMVHPNKMATQFVFEKFTETCINDDAQMLMKEIKNIITAHRHRSFQPLTGAHKKFMQSHYQKTKELKQQFPYLDFQKELYYFSGNSETL